MFLDSLVYWKGKERRLILTMLGSINVKLEVRGISVGFTVSSA